MTTAAGFAVARTFFSRFARRGIYAAAVIFLRSLSALRAFYAFVVFFNVFLEHVSAIFTFVFKKRHILYLRGYFSIANAFCQ